MKKLLLATLAIFTLAIAQPAQANPAFFFIATAGVGAFVATEYETCKAEGIDFKDCAKKLHAERTDVPITQKLYKEMYND